MPVTVTPTGAPIHVDVINTPIRVDIQLYRPAPAAGGGGITGPFRLDWTTPVVLTTVNHNLGFKPLVEAFTPGGVLVSTEVHHINDNQFTVTTEAPFAGYVLAR